MGFINIIVRRTFISHIFFSVRSFVLWLAGSFIRCFHLIRRRRHLDGVIV